MIFVTVGAQMPFDRLIRTVDDWARLHGRKDVFAQIGATRYRPHTVEWTPFLAPQEFRERIEAAELLVAHAGMGSILTALQYGKPILVMPRRGDLHETRNDHQVATAEKFLSLGHVRVALDAHELPKQLDALLASSDGRSLPTISATASEPLILALRRFIATATRKDD